MIRTHVLFMSSTHRVTGFKDATDHSAGKQNLTCQLKNPVYGVVAEDLARDGHDEDDEDRKPDEAGAGHATIGRHLEPELKQEYHLFR